MQIPEVIVSVKDKEQSLGMYENEANIDKPK